MPAENATGEPVGFLGHFKRGIERGRLIVPLDWRPEGAPTLYVFVGWPVPRPECLLALPPARWQKLRAAVAEIPLVNGGTPDLERKLTEESFSRSLDSYGRFVLPDEALHKVGIRNEAVLVGRIDKWELWAPDRYEAMKSRPGVETLIERAFENLKV